MYWFITYDRENKKACIERCFNDSYLTQQVAELIDKQIPINSNAHEESTTTKEELIKHIEKMGYEYVEYSIIEYYKNYLEEQQYAESIKLYYKDYTRLEDNMNLEDYAKKLLQRIDNDFSEKNAKAIVDIINATKTTDKELLNQVQKNLLVEYIENELVTEYVNEANDAHMNFVNVIKSMINKEK